MLLCCIVFWTSFVLFQSKFTQSWIAATIISQTMEGNVKLEEDYHLINTRYPHLHNSWRYYKWVLFGVFILTKYKNLFENNYLYIDRYIHVISYAFKGDQTDLIRHNCTHYFIPCDKYFTLPTSLDCVIFIIWHNFNHKIEFYSLKLSEGEVHQQTSVCPKKHEFFLCTHAAEHMAGDFSQAFQHKGTSRNIAFPIGLDNPFAEDSNRTSHPFRIR